MKIKATITRKNALDLAQLMSHRRRVEAVTVEDSTAHVTSGGKCVPVDGYAIFDANVLGEKAALLTAGALGLYGIPFEIIE